MPIEIRELIIRTHITSELRAGHKPDEKQNRDREKDLVDRCVTKVLQQLNKKNQR